MHTRPCDPAELWSRLHFATKLADMDHPKAIRPEELVNWSSEKIGKSTIFRSDRVMVDLSATQGTLILRKETEEGFVAFVHGYTLAAEGDRRFKLGSVVTAESGG
jgi:hypothetical protein